MIHDQAPKLLWQHFSKISAIPRASKEEGKIREFYRQYAHDKGWEFKEDQIGNMVIKKPATSGYEKSPKIILQGHVDMVCQKNESSSHDFTTDGIELIVDGEWLQANETTLGADNGVGVSAAMAILEDKDAQHGPLEVLLTVDEEAGMGGVQNLAPNWLDGEYLINLDSEEWGACCVGCAGGVDIMLSRELHYDNDARGAHFEIVVSGLKGGHSGLNIDQGLGNANLLLAEFLNYFSQNYTLRLSSFEGGTLRNAITREAKAVISIDASHQAELTKVIEEWQHLFISRFNKVDEGVMLTARSVEPQLSMDADLSRMVLNVLTLLPYGVIRQSVQLPVVETSCNIGVVNINKEKGARIGLLARSLTDAGLDLVILRVKSLGLLSDMFVEACNQYPAWEPDLDSVPLQVLQKTYKELYNEEIRVEVIHAGLETGLIGKLYPKMQMVSFGPTIMGAHSPTERVNIPSVEKFYNLLKALLANLQS